MINQYQLSRVQFNNIIAAQSDLDVIDNEIKRAVKSGVPVDENLIDDCKECRNRLNNILENYKMVDEKGMNQRGKSTAKSTRRQL